MNTCMYTVYTGRLSNSQLADRRRETYLCKKEDAVGSTNSEPLLLGDISYEDSLMSYVKDLGPTAQLVAKRKLLGQLGSNTCPQPKQFKTFRDFAPASCNPFIKASNTTRDVEEAKLEHGSPAGCNPFVKASNTTQDGEEAKLEHRNPAGCNPFVIASNTTQDEEEAKLEHRTPAGCNPTVKASNTTRDGEEAKLEHRRKDKKVTATVRDLNCSSRPVILALENCHSEFKPRNKKNCNVPATPKPVCDEAAPQQPEKHLPVLSHFTFDLPFFKARLEQIKAVEMGSKRKKAGLSIYQ